MEREKILKNLGFVLNENRTWVNSKTGTRICDQSVQQSTDKGFEALIGLEKLLLEGK